MTTSEMRGGIERGPVERLPVDALSPWWAEHRSRYRFALPFVPGLRVLDIASGTGYGSGMLEQAGASSVRGCDVSAEAVRAAERDFGSDIVSFVQGDGVRLPFPDGEFDVIVSFETLEHVEDGDAFVRELRRVLTPGGTLILSTPNETVTRHYSRNPYHITEYTPSELRSLLGRYFSDIELLGQTLGPGWRIAPFLPGWDSPRSVADRFRLVGWKLGLRLPLSIRDALSRLVLGRSLFPGEEDYRFVEQLDRAHVLLAVCTGTA
jgi:SAM-dependent methyltransferase